MNVRKIKSTIYEEDEDDNNFVTSRNQDYKNTDKNRWEDSNLKDEPSLEQIKLKIGKTENDSLASTQRALRMLNDTEDVGIKTSEELNRQGEKLNNMDRQLDDVNQTLNASQKHINSVKGIFGGLKNKLKLKKRSSKTEKTEEKRSGKQLTKSHSLNTQYQSPSQEPTQKLEFAKISGSDREAEINKNLEDMSMGLSRLTDIAKGMSFEMDRQNAVIERVDDKTRTTNDRIENQNKQMKKVLK